MKVGSINSQAFGIQFIQRLLMRMTVSIPLPHTYHGYLGVDRLQVSCACGCSATVMPDLQDRAALAKASPQDTHLRWGFAIACEQEGDITNLDSQDYAVVVGVIELQRTGGIEESNVHTIAQGEAVPSCRELHCSLPYIGVILLVGVRRYLETAVDHHGNLRNIVLG